MTGSDFEIYGIKSIGFSDYWINHDYETNQQPVLAKDTNWFNTVTFRGTKMDEEWDELKITVVNELRLTKEDIPLATLTTQTIYLVPAGLSFAAKGNAIKALMPITFGHAQGGWVVKNKTCSIQYLLPQPFAAVHDETALLQTLYEQWE